MVFSPALRILLQRSCVKDMISAIQHSVREVILVLPKVFNQFATKYHLRVNVVRL